MNFREGLSLLETLLGCTAGLLAPFLKIFFSHKLIVSAQRTPAKQVCGGDFFDVPRKRTRKLHSRLGAQVMSFHPVSTAISVCAPMCVCVCGVIWSLSVLR